jgi:CO dehydrogenase/acetyl-CoA synthase alpha subunit
MNFKRRPQFVVIYVLFVICITANYGACDLKANKSATLTVDASSQSGRKIPDILFGAFFEVIIESNRALISLC